MKILFVLFGVLFSRSNKTATISGHYGTQYSEHVVVSRGEITDTAVNIALHSAVMVEAHDRETIGNHKYGAGSGVIISDTGDEVIIVTNYHVCMNVYDKKTVAPYIYVLLYDYINVDNSVYESRRIRCSYVGGSYNEDVAVIKFARTGAAEALYEASGAMPVTIGDSSAVYFAENIFAIGNPSGKGISVTKGVVSRPIAWSTVDVNGDNINEVVRSIQIDAAINSGNSCGGLFDPNGNWIGIVSSKVSTLENTSYAVPSNEAYGVAWNIIRNNGVLKVAAPQFKTEIESRVVTNSDGAISYVYDTVATSSAYGVVAGDVLESIRYVNPDKGTITVDLHKPYALEEQMLYLVPGDTIIINVKRGSSIVAVEITISTGHISVRN